MKGYLWLIGVFVIAIPVGYFFMKPNDKPLPVYNPVDLNDSLVDKDLERKGFGHRIGDFAFLNQDSVMLTAKNIDNKIWIAEYFFTTCGSICPKMNEQMKRVQKAFSGEKDVMLLSFTCYPEVDTVAQMRRHAESLGAVLPQWQFLTGDKEDLYSLARRSLFLLKPAEVKNQGDGNSDFIHTDNFVLVDKKRRIRGYYKGTDPEEVSQMIKDIERLQKSKT